MSIKIVLGDSLQELARLPADSVDSVVTDPPYELGFMGKKWDSSGIAYNVQLWAEVLRVLKPGGHLLSFGGTRTYHRMVVAIEDAGFEIRDMIEWIYGSGFPKSRNLQGKHQGWGTALKPAHEPIVVARKPLREKTVAANVLALGTGALNIDASRIGAEQISAHNAPKGTFAGGELGRGSDTTSYSTHIGRWPANVILDEEAAHVLDEQQPKASRFFYIAKPSKSERPRGEDGTLHPTVKPLTLMKYLVRMVTPPGGVVLDPFAGSGATLEAAERLGFDSVGIELTPEYLPLIQQRIARAEPDS